MIEVMVAATILVVIVMMLGMLFQQTSIAWRTGLMRSDGYMQLRALIGAIQRDASAMIDANQIPKDLRGKGDQSFGETEIRFYTLSSDLPAKSDNSPVNFRALNFVEYKEYKIEGLRTMRRTQYRLQSDGSWEDEDAGTPLDILDFLSDSTNPNSEDDPQVSVSGFNVTFRDGNDTDIDGKTVSGNNRFPLFITVEAKVTQRGRLYDVGAESWGRDKTPDTKDDIRTWVNE